jgi:membrane fusion protein, multidrug efflux system
MFWQKFIIMLGLLAISTSSFADEPAVAKNVDVIKIAPTTFKQSIQLIGTVNAKYHTVLKAKTTGNLEYIAEAGVTVKQGQDLVLIENNQAIKSYEITKNAAEVAKDKYDRLQKYEKSGYVSKNDLNAAHQQWLEAQKQVQAAKAVYDSNVMTAPFDGIVGVAKFRPGAQVNQGDELLVLYKPDEIVVDLNIPEKIVSKVAIGQKVLIDEKEFQISSVQKFIDQKTHMAPAVIKYPCPSCIIGSSINVDVIIYENPNAITVPHYAVTSKNKEESVFKIVDNKAKLTKITTSNTDKGLVEISSGISEGDLVVVKGMQKLEDGEAVNPTIVTKNESN